MINEMCKLYGVKVCEISQVATLLKHVCFPLLLTGICLLIFGHLKLGHRIKHEAWNRSIRLLSISRSSCSQDNPLVTAVLTVTCTHQFLKCCHPHQMLPAITFLFLPVATWNFIEYVSMQNTKLCYITNRPNTYRAYVFYLKIQIITCKSCFDKQ